jgi:hypothetical protein
MITTEEDEGRSRRIERSREERRRKRIQTSKLLVEINFEHNSELSF